MMGKRSELYNTLSGAIAIVAGVILYMQGEPIKRILMGAVIFGGGFGVVARILDLLITGVITLFRTPPKDLLIMFLALVGSVLLVGASVKFLGMPAVNWTTEFLMQNFSLDPNHILQWPEELVILIASPIMGIIAWIGFVAEYRYHKGWIKLIVKAVLFGVLSCFCMYLIYLIIVVPLFLFALMIFGAISSYEEPVRNMDGRMDTHSGSLDQREVARIWNSAPNRELASLEIKKYDEKRIAEIRSNMAASNCDPDTIEHAVNRYLENRE